MTNKPADQQRGKFKGRLELSGELRALIKDKNEGERGVISLFSPAAGPPFL